MRYLLAGMLLASFGSLVADNDRNYQNRQDDIKRQQRQYEQRQDDIKRQQRQEENRDQ